MDIKLPPPNTCPPELRQTIQLWQQGKANGHELVEASHFAMLEFLPDYARKSLPTPPEPVRYYQQMTPEERQQVTPALRESVYRQHRTYFAQAESVHAMNRGHAYHLRELLAWAQATGIPVETLTEIQTALNSHEDALELGEEREPGSEG